MSWSLLRPRAARERRWGPVRIMLVPLVPWGGIYAAGKSWTAITSQKLPHPSGQKDNFVIGLRDWRHARP
jgi:hypothetical protein